MGSATWAGWDLCAASGGTWMLSNFKTDTVITLFCLPLWLFVLSPTKRGLLAWW